MVKSHNTISLSCKLIRNVTPEFEVPEKGMEGHNIVYPQDLLGSKTFISSITYYSIMKIQYYFGEELNER